MRRLLGAGIPLLATLAIPSIATGEQRFPPPEFTIPYEIPGMELQTVSNTTTLEDWSVFALFFMLLGAATYLTIVQRSRRGLLAVSVVSVLLLGFCSQGCICAIGSIQNVTVALFDSHYALPLTVIGVFALPLIMALFFGRTFCSSVCPFGALQELVLFRPVQVPRWVDHALGLFRYVYLGLAVYLAATGTAMIICQYDPFVGFFRLDGSFAMLLTGGVLLVIGVFVGRPYCRYICPYGALLSLCAKVSTNRPRITPDECISCRLCEEACPYGAIEPPTAAPSEAVRKAGRKRLAWMLALAPLIVGAGACVGWIAGEPLSLMHPTIRTAERVRAEALGYFTESNDISDAFRTTPETNDDLYARAMEVRETFLLGGVVFGAWLGLVVSVKLIQLSIRRKRPRHDLDAGRCVACGRCYEYCPVERERRGLIDELPVVPRPVDENA